MTENPIRKALEFLAKRGWGRYQYLSSDGKVCMMGALALATSSLRHNGSMALTPSNEIFECSEIITSVLQDQFSDRMKSRAKPWIPGFNDHRNTTLEDVITVMEKAAIRWDELQIEKEMADG